MRCNKCGTVYEGQIRKGRVRRKSLFRKGLEASVPETEVVISF